MGTLAIARRGFCAALFLTTAHTALAQSVPPSADQGENLAEIIVTAQKRAERLQDVPIAVSAITNSELESGGIKTTQDLQLAVPALNYTASGGYAHPYMRGIGNSINMPNAEPGVATYVDGIYRANNSDAVDTLLAVDRVEILRGPQGTLYGRNATGGAIGVITRSPGDELAAQISGTVGNYKRLEAQGYLEVPVAPNISAGIYGMYMQRDSFFKNIADVPRFPGEPPREQTYAVRGKLVFLPTESLKVTLAGQINRAETHEVSSYRQI